MDAPEAVLTLVERFAFHLDAYRSGSYNETQLRRDFLDPFWKALGWDVHNEQGFAEAYREDRDMFPHCLGDQQPVERVAVMQRKAVDVEGVGQLHGKGEKAVLLELFRDKPVRALRRCSFTASTNLYGTLGTFVALYLSAHGELFESFFLPRWEAARGFF